MKIYKSLKYARLQQLVKYINSYIENYLYIFIEKVLYPII